MSASPGPSGSVPPMLGFTVDDFWDALGDSPASSAAETWLQNLQAGGEMPTPQELIGLLSALLQERAPAPPIAAAALVAVNAIDALLIQDNPPDDKHFPHRPAAGAGRWEEDAKWVQCKSKMTHIVARLVDAQGNSIQGSALLTGGLEVQVTLVNASTGATIHHNPKKPNEPMLRGVAKGYFEPCAAASAWFL